MNLSKILKEELLKEYGALELFHGSIHNFDTFDFSKIGTGDGNDVHGWGLYFTDSRDVANHYANIIGGRRERFIYTAKVTSNNFLEWDSNIDEYTASQILRRFERITDDEDQINSMMEVLGLSEDYYGEHPWFQQLYAYLVDSFETKKGASMFLSKCGFTGIKFDAKESGILATNYVVFSGDDLRMIDKDRV